METLKMLKFTSFTAFLIFIAVQFNLVTSQENCLINTCNPDYSMASYVNESCHSRGFTNIIGRCCRNSAGKLGGLDLTDCNLTKVESIIHEGYDQLIVLGLVNNPIYNCSTEQFEGFSTVEELFLPKNCSCPGDEETWEKNGTVANGIACYNQTNPCLDINCAPNSHCVHHGPGVKTCECIDGHYGYKCLRVGTFPSVTFILSVIIPTVVLSFFLWFTQRRKIIKQD